MPRVSRETIEKLQAFIDSLPEEARTKCATCTTTLTHIVKKAEVETGAGTATVTRALADKINETAAPHDKVTGHALNERVRQREGLNDPKIRNPENKPDKPKHIDKMKYHRADSKVSDSFNRAFEIFLSAIRREREKKWAETSKEVALQYIEIFIENINQ